MQSTVCAYAAVTHALRKVVERELRIQVAGPASELANNELQARLAPVSSAISMTEVPEIRSSAGFESVVTVRNMPCRVFGIDALNELRMQLQGVCYVRIPVGALRLGSQPATKHVGRTRWKCDP